MLVARGCAHQGDSAAKRQPQGVEVPLVVRSLSSISTLSSQERRGRWLAADAVRAAVRAALPGGADPALTEFALRAAAHRTWAGVAVYSCVGAQCMRASAACLPRDQGFT
jgi:hypothetical protein